MIIRSSFLSFSIIMIFWKVVFIGIIASMIDSIACYPKASIDPNLFSQADQEDISDDPFTSPTIGSDSSNRFDDELFGHNDINTDNNSTPGADEYFRDGAIFERRYGVRERQLKQRDVRSLRISLFWWSARLELWSDITQARWSQWYVSRSVQTFQKFPLVPHRSSRVCRQVDPIMSLKFVFLARDFCTDDASSDPAVSSYPDVSSSPAFELLEPGFLDIVWAWSSLSAFQWPATLTVVLGWKKCVAPTLTTKGILECTMPVRFPLFLSLCHRQPRGWWNH